MAVGTFLPEIELWNLDSEQAEPMAVLGSLGDGKNLQAREDSHSAAVLSMSLNPI